MQRLEQKNNNNNIDNNNNNNIDNINNNIDNRNLRKITTNTTGRTRTKVVVGGRNLYLTNALRRM